MPRLTEVLSENLQRVRHQVAAACSRAGRSTEDVTLIAVTKYAELDWVKCLIDLGVSDFGESRPQQLVSRATQLPPHIRWHQIGHVQRNKVEMLLPFVAKIHSIDSVRLIDALEVSSKRLACRPQILIEVNVAEEESKDGFRVEETVAQWTSIVNHQTIAVEGLMTMAPLSENPESARTTFRTLRELRSRLFSGSADHRQLPHLSMGMSGDFEVAIEEGATLIRIGSLLFAGLA